MAMYFSKIYTHEPSAAELATRRGWRGIEAVTHEAAAIERLRPVLVHLNEKGFREAHVVVTRGDVIDGRLVMPALIHCLRMTWGPSESAAGVG